MIRKKRGFTLLEVMVATAVLSMGILLVYESFFSVLRSFDYCTGYFASSDFFHERLWEAADSIRREGRVGAAAGGAVSIAGRNYDWQLSQESLGDTLYGVTCVLNWKSGRRNVSISRTSYALYEKIPE